MADFYPAPGVLGLYDTTDYYSVTPSLWITECSHVICIEHVREGELTRHPTKRRYRLIKNGYIDLFN